jgi:uncharacterized protein YwqG
MKFTTRKPEFDVEELFPFLRGLGLPTLRLHPRRQQNLPPNISKFGGNIVWSRDEPFPEDPYSEMKAVPVLQLRQENVPNMPFMPETNLMQLLWIPQSSDSTGYDPKLEVFWRKLEASENTVVLEPDYHEDEDMYRVEECAIHLEQVIEYPYLGELSYFERQAIHAWEATISPPLPLHFNPEPVYQYRLSTCPGSKVGGYPDWSGQDPRIPTNAQNQPLEYLLTISDNEWHGGSYERWRPIEQISPPYGQMVFSENSDGSVTQRQVFTAAEELENSNWDLSRHNQYNDDCNALSTYLKYGMNVFLDRSVNPWKVVWT